ncbi:lipocalin-like domain-containing protein [Zoogloea sp.]|uniref:lipocalin-like domain-containing protein n=1 Tax=Zoogloea sp. TaxID=49181 RepID=UPI00262EC90B|nr:lipocalin-like domain-containing protein [Zoogloea sp.]MDD3355155.1 lipocalin-like domain-containing protein [Zoogloea sp.]
MERRRFLLGLAGALAAPAWGASFEPVLPGRRLVFPADHGAHPGFRTEWWYATGWLSLPDGQPLGFQVTFFRVRTGVGEDNPSAFAPRQLILAHGALSDPRKGALRHAERSARAGLGRAGFSTETTRVWLGDWRFELTPRGYRAEVRDEGFAYALDLRTDAPPLLNGRGGFSQKVADPRHASYYYSRPQLQVTGTVTLEGMTQPVRGSAWLDHEWSSELMPEGAQGWDWVGLNLDDGSGLMAFRMRNGAGEALWTAGTLCAPDGRARVMAPGEVRFTPLRRWHAPRSGIDWPVAWRLQVAGRTFELVPLMDDQELDSRGSTGAIYWEGAVRVREQGREVGRGYLEMTGYGKRIRVG